MKRLLALLLLSCLPLSALSETGVEEVIEDVMFYDPIPWADEIAPYPPHEECYLPDDAGYHDDSLDIRVETFRSDRIPSFQLPNTSVSRDVMELIAYIRIMLTWRYFDAA